MDRERLERQFDFIKEIDKEKFIQRQTKLSDGIRRENDAEHAWHMAIMTVLLSEYANEKIDVLRTVTMLLIHDIVEIDAGDTYAYDEEGQKTQHERESRAADRIYSLLPEDQKKKLRDIWEEFEESIEVVIAGYQKKNRVLSNKEKLIVSYHEIGHALVAAKQTESAPVHKITIIPRTSGALGYTMQVDEKEHFLMSKEELENKIATFTGGRAAEELIFHSITTGASNDIEQATKIARGMISQFGMSEDFDMVAMQNVSNQYLGGDATLACSFETQTLIDKKVVELVKAQHDKALKILQDNIGKLHELAQYLYEHETITGEEFMQILNTPVPAVETNAASENTQTIIPEITE